MFDGKADAEAEPIHVWENGRRVHVVAGHMRVRSWLAGEHEVATETLVIFNPARRSLLRGAEVGVSAFLVEARCRGSAEVDVPADGLDLAAIKLDPLVTSLEACRGGRGLAGLDVEARELCLCRVDGV